MPVQMIYRSLQEARRKTEEAATIADSYFASAYADRDSSPAILDVCLRHGIDIGLRRTNAEVRRINVDFSAVGRALPLSGITGIDFLLMFVPALIQSIELAAPGTTVHVGCEELSRLGGVTSDARWRQLIWVNRRNATYSIPGVALSIRSSSSALDAITAGNWLRGSATTTLRTPSRGILHGIQKAKGLLGIAVSPMHDRFELLLALPVC